MGLDHPGRPTKIVPVIRLGPRTLAVAYAVVHELRHWMRTGYPRPVFTTAGLRLYFYALTAHFGHWITPAGSRKRVWQFAAEFLYGQVKKFQRRRRLIKVELELLWGEWKLLRSRLKAASLTGRLNTAFIEHLNLTLRPSVALSTRRTWGAAQQQSQLTLHVEWWRGYYHFARYHEVLRIERTVPRRSCAPSSTTDRTETTETSRAVPGAKADPEIVSERPSLQTN